MSAVQTLSFERMVLTIALNQLSRGEPVPENIATACILALGRVTGRVEMHGGDTYRVHGITCTGWPHDGECQ